MTLYVTADQHFGHANIIAYENRPFVNVDVMNAELIKRWNSVVKKSDTVIVLGDFALTTKEKTTEIFNQLKGTKWLLLGNHDRRKGISWWSKVGFAKVFEFPIIYKEFFILSHQPVYVNYAMPYINIHGHVHSKSYVDSCYVNVSVENADYFPVRFDEIKNRLK